jgi:predicted nucleic acid-binding protein
MEALACQALFSSAEQGTVTLVWSFMHQDETLVCPFPLRQQEALRLSALCKVRIGPEAAIYVLAQRFQLEANLAAKDAIHLACAIFIQAEAFITCDDSLIRRAQRLNLSLKLANPVDYIRHEGM